jgi:outer membrane protein assembly factor BamB
MKNKSIIISLLIFSFSLIFGSCTGRSSMIASGWAGLTTDDEAVYVSFNSHVIAVNLTNGTERWRYPQEANQKISFFATPTLFQDTNLIVGGYDNILYRINKSNGQGEPFFMGANGRYIGGALVYNDMIYAPSADNTLYAIDQDGNLIWSYETEQPLWAKPVSNANCDCIILSSMDHHVYALDSLNGELIWETESLGGSIVGTPEFSDDEYVYIGTFANQLIALNAVDGSILWTFPTNDWVWSGPVVMAETIYFGDLSGTFFAVNRYDGTSLWQFQPGSAIVGSPLIQDDGIYFTTEDGTIFALNLEGTVRWSLPIDTTMQAGPIIAGDQIIVATSNPDTLLISIDPSGVQKWSYSLEN